MSTAPTSTPATPSTEPLSRAAITDFICTILAKRQGVLVELIHPNTKLKRDLGVRKVDLLYIIQNMAERMPFAVDFDEIARLEERLEATDFTVMILINLAVRKQQKPQRLPERV